jgi:predicted nucleotidyltransferase component of viral defense system
MLVGDILQKYIELGFDFGSAQNLAAEEIILNKIASSPLAEQVTLKGGMVMFNLTKSNRRVTQDIDFDLIRFSIDDTSIKIFVEKLNSNNDGIFASIQGDIEPLHQENYHGVRVHILLKDTKKGQLNIKLDIGVHTYLTIKQEKILFAFEGNENSISLKVNPCEQIFVEKSISLAKLGPISKRYKDIYDIYYLIENNLLNISRVKRILGLFFEFSKKPPHDINEFYNSIEDALDNKAFAEEAKKPASKWLDVDYEIAKDKIMWFIAKL